MGYPDCGLFDDYDRAASDPADDIDAAEIPLFVSDVYAETKRTERTIVSVCPVSEVCAAAAVTQM